MSGERPLGRLAGERLPSSWNRYFSFWRRTLDTVLHQDVSNFSTFVLKADRCTFFQRRIELEYGQKSQIKHQSTNVPPISVCLADGLSSAYWHICLRSESVNVLRGVDADLDEVAETGVGRGAIVIGCMGCTVCGYVV